MKNYYPRYIDSVRAIKYENKDSFIQLFGVRINQFFNINKGKHYLKSVYGPKNHPSPGEWIVWRNDHRIDFLTEEQFITEFTSDKRFQL